MNTFTDIEKENIMDKFLNMLPMLRTRLNLTQEQFGKMIGMTRQTIIYIENRKRKLTWSLFLSMIFVFYMNDETKPFLLADMDVRKVFIQSSNNNNSMLNQLKNQY